MGGNCVKRDYFGEHFILPWGRKLIDSCIDLDDQIIPYLQKKLLRVMELNKKSKSSTQTNKSPALNRKCSSKNVNIIFVIMQGIARTNLQNTWVIYIGKTLVVNVGKSFGFGPN